MSWAALIELYPSHCLVSFGVDLMDDGRHLALILRPKSRKQLRISDISVVSLGYNTFFFLSIFKKKKEKTSICSLVDGAKCHIGR